MDVIASDEHWSTSSPGQVASLSQRSRVVDYAKSTGSRKPDLGVPVEHCQIVAVTVFHDGLVSENIVPQITMDADSCPPRT
jgi:hypothetical protein